MSSFLRLSSSGHYLFIEATRREEEKKAMLSSLELRKASGGTCQLEFYYHAYGDNLGELNVLIEDDIYAVALVSEDEWKKYEIDLKDVSGEFKVLLNIIYT